ncbi:hypothetical protein DENSPDRAFT_64624 [Dentipellis sp. KUC8613]|nr:hypothetical protein DENSPDRAFT_64624 [Dentipellis sp. KUC8613]
MPLSTQTTSPSHRSKVDWTVHGPLLLCDNILKAIQTFVHGAQPEDVFVFHYTGHSRQEKAKVDPNEDDGLDEFIVGCDHKALRDDLVHQHVVDPLPRGCRLTAILDACHSGTLLDLDHYHCHFRNKRRHSHTNLSEMYYSPTQINRMPRRSSTLRPETELSLISAAVTTAVKSYARFLKRRSRSSSLCCASGVVATPPKLPLTDIYSGVGLCQHKLPLQATVRRWIRLSTDLCYSVCLSPPTHCFGGIGIGRWRIQSMVTVMIQRRHLVRGTIRGARSSLTHRRCCSPLRSRMNPCMLARTVLCPFVWCFRGRPDTIPSASVTGASEQGQIANDGCRPRYQCSLQSHAYCGHDTYGTVELKRRIHSRICEGFAGIFLDANDPAPLLSLHSYGMTFDLRPCLATCFRYYKSGKAERHRKNRTV